MNVFCCCCRTRFLMFSNWLSPKQNMSTKQTRNFVFFPPALPEHECTKPSRGHPPGPTRRRTLMGCLTASRPSPGLFVCGAGQQQKPNTAFCLKDYIYIYVYIYILLNMFICSVMLLGWLVLCCFKLFRLRGYAFLTQGYSI